MSKPIFFDIHSHVNFRDFDSDRSEVIQRALSAGVWMINVGSNLEDSKKAIEIAEKYDEGVYATVGVHPTDNLEVELPLGSSTSKLRDLAQHPKVVAIGECGLDYAVFARERSELLQKRASAEAESEGGLVLAEKERQKELFKQQIELAIELDKPLMIHCRNSHEDVTKTLEEYKCEKLRGNLHFFAGSLDDAQKYFSLDFSISFTGVITFSKYSHTEDLKKIPLDKIMIETDAPFVAPVPYRGKRNEPFYVIETAKKMAEIRGVPIEEIAKATTENALKLFKIEKP